MEVIRRYPGTVEMFDSSFQESFKAIGSRNLKEQDAIKKIIFLLYCELCLLGVIGKENVIGKAMKAMLDVITNTEVRSTPSGWI